MIIEGNQCKQPVILADLDGLVGRLMIEIPKVLVVEPNQRLPEPVVEPQVILEILLELAVFKAIECELGFSHLVEDTIQLLKLEQMRPGLDVYHEEYA